MANWSMAKEWRSEVKLRSASAESRMEKRSKREVSRSKVQQRQREDAKGQV